MADNAINEIESAVGQQQAQGAFTASTFIGKQGGVEVVKGQVAPNYPGRNPFRDTVSLAAALWILKDIEGFKATAVEASRMTKREGEAERLRKAKAEREAAKAAKKAGKPTTKSQQALDDELAEIESAQ